MALKIDRFLADKRIDLNEAHEIAAAAKASGPNGDGKVTEKAHDAVASVLQNADIFIEADARPLLEAVVAAPVMMKEADPTKRTKLFRSDEPLKLKLSSDFAQLFAQKAGAGRTPGFPGTLEFEEAGMPQKIPLNVRTRGQSSIQTLPEPKLKVKLDANARKGTIFEKEGSLEIGVQGGAGGKDALGRVLIPEAPVREAAAYSVLEEMGLCVPRARVANFDYVDAQGRVRSQPAFLCEDADSLAKRYFGDKGTELGNIGNPDAQPDVRATLKTEDVLRLNLGLMLVGNQDWMFSVSGDKSKPTVTGDPSNMHNTKMIFLPDPTNPKRGEAKPVATDFDLSNFVLQKEYAGYWNNQNHPINYPEDLKPLHAQFPSPQFDQVVNDVLSRKDAMLGRLEKYPLDDASKAFMRAQLNAFFEAARGELGIAAVPAQPVEPPVVAHLEE
jgi:hypothetical protein